jgi:DNA-binding NtrC family response regulator
MAEAGHILLVDDQPANLGVLREMLEARGYGVVLAPNGQVALRNATHLVPDLVLLDVNMPDLDGFEVCRRLKAEPRTADIPVVFITARDLKGDIVRGFEVGGCDYVTKPVREEEVLARVRTHLQLHRLTRELTEKNAALEREVDQRRRLSGRLSRMAQSEMDRWGLERFVGESPTIRRIFDEIRLMQAQEATSVLIVGESGTGKELIARAIHHGGLRAEGPFIPVNCAAMPSELVESMLFGHVKGAFTGADDDREGFFEAADGGTLFLDEIGEMPLELQAKLLRVLEDGEVWPVGARQGRQVDVRILAATNVDLQQKLRSGALRQDLFYRLARYTVEAPPLRHRPDDIPLLAQHFLKLFAHEMGREAPELTVPALERLRAYVFPGNVRELKNVIERSLIESGGADITTAHLRFQDIGTVESGSDTGGIDLPLDLDEATGVAQLWVVRRALEMSGGNVSEATRLLRTNRPRVYRILDQERVDTTGGRD